MASRNLPASKRGWGYDSVMESLDIYVNGVAALKFAGAAKDANIYSASSTQLYPLGTRLHVDERVFRYCRAGSTITRARGVFNNDQWSVTNEEPNNGAAIGATTISVVNTAATADLYTGGWAVIYTSPFQVRHLTGNSASDGTDCNLYIDGGLDVAITADSTWVTAYPSIYYDTRTASTIGAPARNYISFVAWANQAVTSGYYYWGQTWGPACGTVESVVPGATVNSRRVCFSPNGHLWSGTTLATGAVYSAQDAGFILPQTASGSGDQLFMLQITP